MILERLVLENFRQFRGRQEIVFSDLRERNITLVHAENGFGKTTLLKALLWAFYGRDGLKEDFEKPDRIIHEGLAFRAKDPSHLAATVELTFRHGDQRYILTRSLTLAQQNLDARQTMLTLESMKDGQTYKDPRPQQRIQTIIPAGISSFLFFNGERINYLAEERSSGQVTEAIQQMLGLKLLRTTIEDLKHQNVRGKLRGELKDVSSGEKRDLLERLTASEARLQELEEQKYQTQKNLNAIAAEMETVNHKLAANREAHELQARRVRLERELLDLKQQRNDKTQRLSRLIAEDGYTLLASGLVERGREIVGRLRSEGKIPARVLNTFLQELLETGKCICTRCLEEGSEERAAVESLLTIAGDQDFNNAVGALDHAIGLIEGVAVQTQEQLRLLNTERLELALQIRRCDEEIEDIHQRLGGKNDETVRDLEEQRKKLELDRDAQSTSLGRIDGQIDEAKKTIAGLEQQIRQLEDQEAAAARAQRRVDAVEDCIKTLEAILEAETQDLRPLLNAEIASHFRKIIDRDYWAELTENYTLRIRKRVAGGEKSDTSQELDAALSTGQRTVTSLVFIASLVALAQRRSEIPTILKDVAGAAFPVVIDSPFGSLSVFRRDIARYIPELAPQVLLFVSPEQYNGQVEAALNEAGRVGKRYYLAYHGPTIPERANPEMVVNGQTIQQYYTFDNDEYTEIVELKL
jgi:DNA sulfur modification protein DndD